jgi:hypothetical protein
MSQSDYIRYKRLQIELSKKMHFPNVLDSGKYISYKEYSLENMIISENDRYDKVIDKNVPVVFGMVKKCASKSPTYIPCDGDITARSYRKKVIPLDSEQLPIFRFSRIGSIEKKKSVKWIPIVDSKYCNCVNI